MTIAITRDRVKLYLWIGLAYLCLWVLIDTVHNHRLSVQRVINNVWAISYLVVFNYILFEFTFPFIKLNLKRILIGIVLLWAHAMFYSFVFYFWRYIGIQLNIYTELKIHETVLKGVEYHVPYSFLSLLFFGIIRYTYDFRMLKEAAQKLRIEKQEAELNYLKSQTNPHFLFNTLNNIYSLARDKNEKAPESILRLSKILRFMLYETDGQYILLEQELKIINDYIELEKLRYDESLRVVFDHDVEDMKQALPPLLLIPLVENAFKHGVSETRGLPFVDIHLSVKSRQLSFVVKNSTEQTGELGIKENIGLSNLRRQLQLLYTDYNLLVKQEQSVFMAILKINLDSHA